MPCQIAESVMHSANSLRIFKINHLEKKVKKKQQKTD